MTNSSDEQIPEAWRADIHALNGAEAIIRGLLLAPDQWREQAVDWLSHEASRHPAWHGGDSGPGWSPSDIDNSHNDNRGGTR